jgi:hypothetical protein
LKQLTDKQSRHKLNEVKQKQNKKRKAEEEIEIIETKKLKQYFYRQYWEKVDSNVQNLDINVLKTKNYKNSIKYVRIRFHIIAQTLIVPEIYINKTNIHQISCWLLFTILT